ncbi:MAG: hypothetical protein KDD38_08375 [Bdellovibrionales bacterium]|nr:hypothetical protein [Bdellovibrionales bacterium]
MNNLTLIAMLTFLFSMFSPLSHSAPSPQVSANKELISIPLDKSLTGLHPQQNQIYYGWELFKWSDWLKRPSSGPLMIPGDYSKVNLEVFEAHSSGIVDKPISTFTKEYLHNIVTIRRLDPKNAHQQIDAQAFTIETKILFPDSWAKIITAAQNTKILDEKSAPFLNMQSVFGYARQQDIEKNESLMRIVKLLDANGQVPNVINIQGIVMVNQIVQFGSVVTLFYRLNANQTLIVNYFALALKSRILDIGLAGSGVNFTGRSVLLGQNPTLNSDSGIGAGLPTYTFEFFDQMLSGFEL